MITHSSKKNFNNMYLHLLFVHGDISVNSVKAYKFHQSGVRDFFYHALESTQFLPILKVILEI